MKFIALTIVLDGMRFLPTQLFTLNSLFGIDWEWRIAEGRADNVLCTKWCKKLAPRLSKDGTTQFLNELRSHPRVKIWQQQLWPGKVSMFNTMLDDIREPCVIMEIDADEIWTPEQLGKIHQSFEDLHHIKWMRFDCVYYVGPNVIAVGNDVYGHHPGEWLRAFRFVPGMKFIKHEPPIMEGIDDKYAPFGLDRRETQRLNLVFKHYAYAFPDQVLAKEEYYGYENALAHWYSLQRNKKWPVLLRRYLPWVTDEAKAELVYKL